MGLASLLDTAIVFFGGKGGVGKTTSATAFALLAARRGQRTLLVSTDPAHSTSDILEHQLGPEPAPVADGLWAMEIDADREAAAYIDRVRHNLFDVTPVNLRAEMERQLEMARVSPGAEEAALFDRVADIVLSVRKDFQTLVFDTAPTGHTLRLLALPELLQAWVDGLLQKRQGIRALNAMWRHMTVGGAADEEPEDPVEKVLLERRRKFYHVRRLLFSPGTTSFVFVLLAERLPIAETRKAVTLLEHHGVPIGGLIVNRILPSSAAEHPFFAARQEQEARYLQEIDTTFPELEKIQLPLLRRDIVGKGALAEISAVLEKALT